MLCRQIVRALLCGGADIIEEGISVHLSALDYAIGLLTVAVDSLIGGGHFALGFASVAEWMSLTNTLLDTGTETETRYNGGQTLLLIVAARGQTDVVRALVSAGADVNTQDDDGVSALSVASQQGFIDIVNILLDRRAQIETRDNLGHRPLHYAAANGQTDVVRALVSAGANVNTHDNEGVSASALSIASNNGCVDIVNILLDSVAQISLTSRCDAANAIKVQMKTATDIKATSATRYSVTDTPLSTQIVMALLRGGADIIAVGISVHFSALEYAICLLTVAVVSLAGGGHFALCFASVAEWISLLNTLLDSDVETETKDNEGHTLLLIVAATGQTDVVRALVSAGADVNVQRNDGVSALGYASEKGHIDIVNILLYKGAHIETRDNEGRTPLWVAASWGQTDVVRALVSAGADVNTQNNDGVSAIGGGSAKGHFDIVNILLGKGVHIETRDNLGRTPLWLAAAFGQTDVVRALVSAGADVNTRHTDGVSVLGYASEKGHVDIVKILLDKGAHIEIRDNVGRTPLWFAAGNGQTDVVRKLVSAGADVNTQNNDGGSALGAASQEGHINTVNVLLDNGAEIECRDNEGRTPLWFAAAGGSVDIVNILLKRGADMHVKNNDNLQLIDMVSYYGHVDIVQILTSCKSPTMSPRYNSLDVIPIDCHRNSALHLTTDSRTAITLLKNGADVEAENVDGLRPIHCAVRTGLVELVELLILHGANVDAADVFGNRPLHDAVCHGLDVVQQLVQHGAKLNVQNIDGKTPLHIAIDLQQSDVIVFLLNQDADVGLTDVWRNTPLHYLTFGPLAVSTVAESVVKVLTNKPQHLFIRNAVDVSVSMQITTNETSHDQGHQLHGEHISFNRIANSPTLVQTHNSNYLNQLKLYTDCNGNTALHCAVGVYGQIKMFKVSTDVTKIVELLVKLGADINAQNNDGLTPLHVARGEKAIEACLQHGGDQSFTITDKRGRNFWHLLFLTRTLTELYDSERTIRPMIAISDGKYSVDDLNRTPLHYACMDRHPHIASWNWLAMEFIKHFSVEHINIRDRFGRTALHYAAIGDKYELQTMLKTMKADDTVKDNYQNTVIDYQNIRSNFRVYTSIDEIFRFHRKKSS